MAKKNKKRSGRGLAAFTWLVTLLPAIFAAATAFWNTSMAREQGFMSDNTTGRKSNSSKKTKRSKRASATS